MYPRRRKARLIPLSSFLSAQVVINSAADRLRFTVSPQRLDKSLHFILFQHNILAHSCYAFGYGIPLLRSFFVTPQHPV